MGKPRIDVETVVSANPAAQAWLEGQGNLDGLAEDVALAAIEVAGKRQLVSRLQTLERAPKTLRKAAALALHKLRSAGVTVDKPKAGTSFNLGSEEISVPPRAFVGAPDEEGYSEFFLSCTDASGTCALMGFYGGGQGLRELRHGHISRSQLRDMAKSMAGHDLVEIPFLSALHMVLPAVERVVNADDKHNWEHFVGHVPAATLSAAREASLATPSEPDLSLLETTGALARTSWFWTLPVSEAALTALVEVVQSGGDVEADAFKAAGARVLDEPAIRAEWARRARLTQVVAEAVGEASMAQVCAHLACALEGSTPASEIPLCTQALILWGARQSTRGAVGAADAAPPSRAPGQAREQHEHHHDHDLPGHSHDHG